MLLAQHDEYQTPPDRPLTLLAKLSPWPELPFYLSVLTTVVRSGIHAMRGGYDGACWAASSLRILDALEGVGIRVTIEGMDTLRRVESPAVFVANHMSTLETFVLPAIIEPVKTVTFVVKESLLRYPFFGPVLQSRDPIAVGRTNPREDLAAVLRGGEERLRKGISVIIFPQGTRYGEVDTSQFNTLGAKLAARAGVPLVPVALQTDAWGTGKRVKDLGRVDPRIPVHFLFGAPLSPQGKGNEAHEACVRFIVENVDRWRAEGKRVAQRDG